MKNHALILSLAAGLTAVSLAAAAEPPAQADRIEVGQQARAFSLASIDGATYALSDLRGKKDLVLVFFRGSW